jgi:hypothetical protein
MAPSFYDSRLPPGRLPLSIDQPPLIFKTNGLKIHGNFGYSAVLTQPPEHAKMAVNDGLRRHIGFAWCGRCSYAAGGESVLRHMRDLGEAERLPISAVG